MKTYSNPDRSPVFIGMDVARGKDSTVTFIHRATGAAGHSFQKLTMVEWQKVCEQQMSRKQRLRQRELARRKHTPTWFVTEGEADAIAM